MHTRSFICLIISFLILVTAQFSNAQQEKDPQSGREPSAPNIPSSVPPQPPMDIPAPPPPQDQDLKPAMIIIAGKVIMEDGSPPPFGTVIERDCGGVVIKEELVDSNGNFNFVVGDSHRASSLFPDATENFSSDGTTGGSYSQRNMRRMQMRNFPEDLAACVVQARYTGYQSTTARLGIDQKRGMIDVGTIVIYPIARAGSNVVSITSLRIPDNARKSWNRGRKAFEDNNLDDAEKHYKAAIQLYPEYADAWIELGWLYQSRQHYKKARNAYMKALESDKSLIKPYIRLAQLSAMEEKWTDAETYSSEALELNSHDYPQAYFFNALAKYNLNDLDGAEESIRKGIELDRANRFPRMQLVLANILTGKMDPYGSMKAMRRYLEMEPDASDADHIRSLVERYKKIAEKLPSPPAEE